MIYTGGVEDTMLETKTKAKDTKKIRGQAKDSPSENRPFRGQRQKCSRPRTKNKSTSVPEKKKRSSQVFREVFSVFLPKFENEQIPTIVGADANAHHTSLRSSDINPRVGIS